MLGNGGQLAIAPEPERIAMNGNRYYGVRVEGAKYGAGFDSALDIAISYTNNHSISLGDHPRHSGLARRDLPVIRLVACV